MSALVRFMGVDIATGPGALIPRAETELCGRLALAKLDGVSNPRALDVCCGTGNLACALATARPDLAIDALDLTDGAVALARANIARLGLAARVGVYQGDLFAALPDDRARALAGALDLIVCNPPYISTGKLATRTDLADEPREAFDGGPYGLSIHQRVAKDALAFLRPGGWLVFEFGDGQARQLELVLGRTKGYDAIEYVNDDTGAPRAVAARSRTDGRE